MCCSSKREREAAKYEQLYPQWEKDDYHEDGSITDEQHKIENEIKKQNDSIL